MRIDQHTMRNLRGGGKTQDWQIWQQSAAARACQRRGQLIKPDGELRFFEH